VEPIGVNHMLHHSNDRRSLVVRNVVEYRTNLAGRVDLAGHRVGGHKRVHLESALHLLHRVDFLQFPFGLDPFGPMILEVPGETLVQPSGVPPLTRDQVSKPLMCRLVSNDRRDTVLVQRRRVLRVEQNGGFSKNLLFSVHFEWLDIFQIDYL
jgi:hypothetical protein